jgi:putative DNA primase/helicase
MEPDCPGAELSLGATSGDETALPPVDLAAWLKRHGTPNSASHPAANAGPRAAAHRPPTGKGTEPSDDRQRRAAAYLARIPGAVSGQRGHDQTFHAACVLVKGFGLTIDEARPLLHDWNKSCAPPWNRAELEHKLKSAAAAADVRPREYLVAPDRKPPSQRLAARTSRPAPPASEVAANGEIETPSGCPPGQEANPHRLASLFLQQQFAYQGGIGLRFWREEFHDWDGSAYRRISTAEIRAQLAAFLAREFERLYQLEAERRLEPAEKPAAHKAAEAIRRPPRPIAVTTRLIGDVVQAIAGSVLVRLSVCPAQPAWVEGFPDSAGWPAGTGACAPLPVQMEGEDAIVAVAAPPAIESPVPPPWPAPEILPARNALVHLPSFVKRACCTVPPSPRFFNAFALDYSFDPAAQPPVEWLAFLRLIWGSDSESIDCLQEWFGYLLTADTRQQKILMMVGPKRSGRGTIARVLKAVAGASNVVNPTLSTLARPFGLSALIDKPVAIFPDARLSSRPDNAAIVECLLSISGEDDQTIDRKHLAAWTGRLPTRFVLISNELPRLKDASGALASRLIILRFTRSFYDQEDTGLFDRLRRELPGILLWAVAGWERLRLRGRFIQPRSARDLVAAMDELASPILTFLQDRCVLAQHETVPVASLYEAWRSWCQEHGRDAVGDEQSFGRDLHAAIPGLSKSRHRHGSARIAHYNGIRLRTCLDPETEMETDSDACEASYHDDFRSETPF